MKSLDEYFYDWESHVFGYGYGTGEAHVILGLQKIMRAISEDGRYDFRKFEECLGPLSAWLFINILCKEGIFEYGTSPRFGWLTKSGEELKKYLEGLHEFKECNPDYHHCYPDLCQCADNNDGIKCDNPFWRN